MSDFTPGLPAQGSEILTIALGVSASDSAAISETEGTSVSALARRGIACGGLLLGLQSKPLWASPSNSFAAICSTEMAPGASSSHRDLDRPFAVCRGGSMEPHVREAAVASKSRVRVANSATKLLAWPISGAQL
jgi:hypothetical protein